MANKKTLVFGASLKPYRYSNIAINRLVSAGHEVKAFGLREGQVGKVKIDTELQVYDDLHTITLYMNKVRQVEFYDYFVSSGASRVIFNPGTENPQLYNILTQNKIEVLPACTLVLLSTNQY